MFEQSSQSYQYQYEPAPEPLKEGDPFYHYEIKNWELGPRIYKILGISALVNIVALVVAVQGSLLTMKGCDSPLVGTMCEVLDTVYVGSMLFGTDREYVDVAYEKTDLGDADITFVDVTGLDQTKLEYPAGYFTIANPEKFTIDPETGEMIAALPPSVSSDIPGIPNNIPYSPPATNSLFDTQPNYPQSNPNPVTGNLPQPGGSVSRPGSRKRGRGGRVNPNPNPSAEGSPDPNTVAEANPSPSPSVEPTGQFDANDVNTRPFKDLAIKVNTLLDKKQLDLQAQVEILATAKLGKDGKIVPGSFKANGTSSDPELANIVTEAVGAFNDSNLLNHLKELSGKNLNFLVRQDQTNIVAAIKSQVESDTRAQSIATVVQFGISLAIQKKEKGIAELEAANDPAKAEALQNLRDDLALLKGTQVGANGKDFVVTFSAPKDSVHQMIQRKLAEQKAEPKQPNSSSVVIKPTDNTAKK
jgi:hypothetical protein